MNDKNNKDTIGIIGLVLGSLGLFSGFIFWLFPFTEILENRSFISSIIFTIKENFHTLFLFGISFLLLSLTLLFLSKRIKSNIQETFITDSDRNALISMLDSRYNERLKQKLNDCFPIELEFQYSLLGVNEKSNLYFDNNTNLINEKNITGKLVDLLEQHSFLLVLGEPGMGKTSQLLKLGITLLEKCTQNNEQPLPIILNLSTFTDEYKIFDDWLQNNLVNMYNFPSKKIGDIVKSNKIILLLDGFDEIGNYLEGEEEKKKLRGKCIDAIHTFKMSELNPRQFVICSRLIEYEQTKHIAPVSAQIKIKNLEIKQIKKSLEKIETESCKNADKKAAKILLYHINDNIALQECICVPFYYNMLLQILFEPKDESVIFPDNVDDLKKFIVDLFINRKLVSNKSTKYTIEKLKKYLSWLSIWAKNGSKVNFELIDFQPNSLRKKYSFHFTKWLISTLVFVVGVQRFYINLVVIHNINIILANIIIIIFCMLIGFIASSDNSIKTHEMLRWNWKKFAKPKPIIIIAAGILSIPFVIFFNLLGFSFSFSLALVLFYVLNLMVLNGFDVRSYVIIKKPYARLLNMKYVFINISLLLGFVFVLTNVINFSLNYNLIIAIVYAFILYSPLFDHLILNFMLWKERSIAFPIVPFLNHCTSLRILETDGGSWRFRHQILQDYFCNHYN